MRLERPIWSYKTEETLMSRIQARRQVPELRDIVCVAPQHRTGRAGIVQFWNGETNEFCEIFFTSHELFTLTSVCLGPFHDVCCFPRLRCRAAKLLHQNRLPSQCSGQRAGEWHKIRIKRLACP